LSDSGDDPNRTEESTSPERREHSVPVPEELIGEIFEDLPPDTQEKVRRFISMSYTGPIPPPWMLGQFNKVEPGAAKQILDDAHAEHLHRREMEKADFEHARDMGRRQLAAAVWESRAGQIFAFVIAILVIGTGAWLIYNDKSGYGFALILLELGGIAAAFLYNDRRQRPENQQAQETLPQQPQQEDEASG
jgi:uncharacterized membrane protein